MLKLACLIYVSDQDLAVYVYLTNDLIGFGHTITNIYRLSSMSSTTSPWSSSIGSPDAGTGWNHIIGRFRSALNNDIIIFLNKFNWNCRWQNNFQPAMSEPHEMLILE